MFSKITSPYVHPNLFTITIHVYLTICSPYMFTVINLLSSLHHMFTISSLCMFTILASPHFHHVCLPCSFHHMFIMYVIIITSPYVHFTMGIHSLLDVHHYHFTYYTNLSPYSSLIIIFYVGSMF